MPNRLCLASNGVNRGLNLPDGGDAGNLDFAGQQCRESNDRHEGI